MNNSSQGSSRFEQTFADLAYAKIQEAAPMLIQHMVGFQVIDKNDDDTHGVGVFGFRVNKQWLYAPVFFINGELKTCGLYLKDKDAFVPLQDNWVNYLLNRRPSVIGSASPYGESDFSMSNPDFRVYARSPVRNSFNKYSCANYDPERSQWATGYWTSGQEFDIKPMLGCFQISPFGPTFKSAAQRMDLSNVARDPVMRGMLYKLAVTDDGIRSGLMRFYDPQQLFPEAVAAAVGRDAAVKSAGDKMEAKSSAESISIDVKIVDNPLDIPGQPTDAQRMELITDGFTVVDGRPEDQLSPVYDDSVLSSFVNPTETGVFDVLMKTGECQECFIGMNPRTIGAGSANGVCVVVRMSDQSVVLANPGDLFVKPSGSKSLPALCHGLESADGMTAGRAYVVIGSGGSVSLPIDILSKSGADLKVYPLCSVGTRFNSVEGRATPGLVWHQHNPIDTYGDRPSVQSDYDYRKYGARPAVVSPSRMSFYDVGSMLVIPSDFKAMPVDREFNWHPEFGSISDAQLAVVKFAGLLPVNIHSDGATFAIGTRRGSADTGYLDKRAAVYELMTGFGVGSDDARIMLGCAESSGDARFFVKASQYGRELGNPMGAPSVSDLDYAQRGYDPSLGVVTEVSEPVTKNVGLPTSGPEAYDPFIDHNPGMDPAVIAAGQAAAAGQKEVMDVSVLASLAKSVNSDRYVNSYVSDLMVGLDRIGRLMFMLYWHDESFEDRYGADELQDLEDALKNTFKAVGDLCLFMRKKEIDYDVTLGGSDVDLSKLN